MRGIGLLFDLAATIIVIFFVFRRVALLAYRATTEWNTRARLILHDLGYHEFARA